MSASQSHEDAYSTQARVAFTSELDSLPEVEFRDPDLWLYRKRTVALLKRYLRISIEVGRLPSLLGPGTVPLQGHLLPDVQLRRCGDLCA
jgi:hypothetical protein